MNGHILSPRIWINITVICLIAISCNLVTGLMSEESAQVTESLEVLALEISRGSTLAA